MKIATQPAALPLWPLPLLAGLLPLVASVAAFMVSSRLGHVPDCWPVLDGCVSISRAAREGLPNRIFQALMLPAATLQALVWWLAARWLAEQAPQPGRAARWRWLAVLGIAAGVALVLYGAFLGSEGSAARLLRRWGTIVYFGFTCIALLLAGGGVQQLAAAGRVALPRWLGHALLSLAALLVTLGLVNTLLAHAFGEALKDRIQNVAEWWAGLIFVLGFVALAALWQRLGLRMRIAAAPHDD